MTFSVISGALAAAVAPAGTFTASYPTGKDKGSFFLAMGHKLTIDGNALFFPADFDVTLGTSSITVTNKSSAYTWPTSAAFKLQMEEIGDRSQITVPLESPNAATGTLAGTQYNVNVRSSVVPSMTQAYLDVIQLGAAITASANSVCLAQAISGTTVTATIAGALASGGVATLDVPRALTVLSTAAGDNSQIVTATGTDVYGYAMKENMALNGVTAVNGLKAFKTATLVTVNVTMAGNLTVGHTDTLGLPVFVPDSGFILAELRDGKPIGSGGTMQVPFVITDTDLLTPFSIQAVSPIAGNITRATAISQRTIVTGGNIAIQVGTTDVVGLTLVFAGSTNPGTVVSDTPTTPGSATTLVTVGSRIQIAPDASFATSGAVSGFVEIAGTNGTFVAGIRTAGGSTATTGDVRGTYKPFTACDGVSVIELVVANPDRYAGIKQFSG